GGWRIIRTLGQRVTRLQPAEGFAAETATATILWFTARLGFPVSTTHTVASAILGAGATKNASAVRWGIAGNIVVAWLITIPCAALVGAGVERLTVLPAGDALAVTLAAAIGVAALYAQGRRSRAVTI
ncbi:MAG: inorganic phosphate transporter, partial [Trebonia sp.]